MTETPMDAPTSLRDELVQSGATPVTVDADALLAQIKLLTARVQAMEAERGIPSDPVKASLLDLTKHVEARAAQYPAHDFSELHQTLTTLPDTLTPTHTALIKALVEDVVARLGHTEVGYFPELARTLDKNVLKGAAGVV